MQFLRDVIVPIILIGMLLFIKVASIFQWIVYSFIFLGYIFIVYQLGSWGRWSFYTRNLILILFLISMGYSYFKVASNPLFLEGITGLYLQVFIDAIILSVLLYFNITIYQGGSYYETPIDLEFPLKNGIFFVADGGSNHYLNYHHKGKYFLDNKITQSMTYALDIQKVSHLGTESKVIFPKVVEDYACFGEKVYSPCEGIVTEVINDVTDDNIYDYENPKGNHVIIKREDLYVVMLHFKQGSIIVREGDYIRRGDYLGQIGNSGLVKRPNLHIQAVVGSPWFGEGVPILFNGKFLVRNKLVSQK